MQVESLNWIAQGHSGNVVGSVSEAYHCTEVPMVRESAFSGACVSPVSALLSRPIR